MFYKIYVSGVLLSTCVASSLLYNNESDKKSIHNPWITTGKSILTAGYSSLIWPLFVPVKTIHCYHSYIKNKE
jgi:hypothetical protein